MLKTPEKIQEFQRKLYQKAKQEEEFRFYLLYDKVYRMDILDHAYMLVKANKGASGVDGVTFESIEECPSGYGRYILTTPHREETGNRCRYLQVFRHHTARQATRAYCKTDSRQAHFKVNKDVVEGFGSRRK